MNRFGHVHDIAHSILSYAHAQSGCVCILLSQHNAHNEPNIMHIVYTYTPVASLASDLATAPSLHPPGFFVQKSGKLSPLSWRLH